MTDGLYLLFLSKIECTVNCRTDAGREVIGSESVKSSDIDIIDFLRRFIESFFDGFHIPYFVVISSSRNTEVLENLEVGTDRNRVLETNSSISKHLRLEK
ncbi:hypothetical protein D9M72_435350 [compost metagenome]